MDKMFDKIKDKIYNYEKYKEMGNNNSDEQKRQMCFEISNDELKHIKMLVQMYPEIKEEILRIEKIIETLKNMM